MITSPPAPPSPPSGPPMGTNFSRRNEEIPEPPSPAFTLMRTRSMNVMTDALPEVDGASQQLVRDHTVQGLKRGRNRLRRHARIEGAVQMRLELTILSRRRTCSNDTQLASRQVELRPAEHLAVAL